MRLRDMFKWQVPPRATRTPIDQGVPVLPAPPPPPPARGPAPVLLREVDEASVIWAGRDPQPGLYEALAKRPLPSYAELRARYGGGVDQPGKCVGCLMERSPEQGIPDRLIPDGDCPIHGEGASAAPEVDFQAALVDDRAAWAVKSRLEAVIGRPYLATKLADQLDAETGAMLADRLEALLHTAYDQARAQIAGEISSVVDAKMREIHADRERRGKEATRERFHGSSRLD